MKLPNMLLLITFAISGSMDLALADKQDVRKTRTQIKKAWSKVKTLSATSLQNNVKDLRVASLSTTLYGTYYLVKKGDKVLVRQDISTSSSMDYKEHDMSTSSGTASTTIGDGEFQYTITEIEGNVAVKKFTQSPMLCIGGLDAMKIFFERYDVRQKSDSKIDGRDVYVFEAIARKKKPRRAILSVDKQYGILLKRDSYDYQGTLRSSLSYHDVKVNEDIDPQKFVFEPPSGIPIEDYTGK